jgi:hypothetical protein
MLAQEPESIQEVTYISDNRSRSYDEDIIEGRA